MQKYVVVSPSGFPLFCGTRKQAERWRANAIVCRTPGAHDLDVISQEEYENEKMYDERMYY